MCSKYPGTPYLLRAWPLLCCCFLFSAYHQKSTWYPGAVFHESPIIAENFFLLLLFGGFHYSVLATLTNTPALGSPLRGLTTAAAVHVHSSSGSHCV